VTRTELLAFWYCTEKCRGVEGHIEAGLLQNASLALFNLLTVNKCHDVWVIGVQDNHLGRAACLTTLLIAPGRSIGPTHKLSGPEAVPALYQAFNGRTDGAQINTTARTTLKNQPSSRYQSRSDSMVSSIPKISTHWPAERVLGANVKPYRRIKRSPLSDQYVTSALHEILGLFFVSKYPLVDR